jgi:hypothetical protein
MKQSQFQDIQDIIAIYVNKLPMNNKVNVNECEIRAGEFLTALASIADFRHMISEDKIKATSLVSSVYSEKLSKAVGKTVTENKTHVEADEDYIQVREQLETTENNINYLKTYQEIFLNAHLYYRQLSKSENL